jgi:hypothetical protein
MLLGNRDPVGIGSEGYSPQIQPQGKEVTELQESLDPLQS